MWLNGELSGDKLSSAYEYHQWLVQGGASTVKSLGSDAAKQVLKQYLDLCVAYHKIDNVLFVHGGIPYHKEFDQCTSLDLMWDRSMVRHAYTDRLCAEANYKGFDRIFCGHVPTLGIGPGYYCPQTLGNIVDIDTGGAYGGCISVVDTSTLAFWQSDVIGAPVKYG